MVQAVGGVNGVNSTGYVQSQQKKNGTGKALITGGLAAGVGAYTGASCSDLFFKESIAEAKDLLDPKKVEYVYKRGLRNTTVGATLTEEMIESLWDKNKKSTLEQAKSSADDALKMVKKAKTKWALIGAGVAGLLGFVLSKGLSKKMAPAGKAENVKNDPYTNQIITTPSGYKIAVPVMMGSSTHIRPAADGSYVVTYAPSKKGAVTEREVLTEQQLLEKYQHWIVQ